MKLYTLGPVEMFEETMEIGGKQVPYFRNNEFSEVVLRCMSRLKNALDMEDDSEIVFLTSSGTGAMEATIMNCFTPEDNLLVIDGGSFGHRFVQLCELHDIPYDAIKVPDGKPLTKEMLDSQSDGKAYTALLVNIHESSTGQLYDKKMLSDFCKAHDMLFVVDAISSFLADEYSMQQYGIDATILSSQKGLSLAPGLSFVALSNRMLSRIENIESHTMYFDFKNHIQNGKRGQTPFTPSIRVILELDKMLEIIESGSVNSFTKRCELIAADFRAKLKNMGLQYPSYPLSNAGTPVIFPEDNADIICNELKNKYELFVNPCGGKLAKKMFRVAHIGNHTIDDNDVLISAMKELLD